MYKKSHAVEFEKYAKNYDLFAKVQKRVAQELIKEIDFKPLRILDIGCGTGEIYKNITWDIERFVGVDCSASMCSFHPKSQKVKIICDDFESDTLKEQVKEFAPYDIVISSSSLQWAKNLKEMFDVCSRLSDRVAFSIFTKGTFKTIYEMSGRESFLPTYEDVKLFSNAFKNIQTTKKIYRLDFEDNISKFRYIRKSGISGGNVALEYKKMKYLLENYPHSYLEFEVTFILN